MSGLVAILSKLITSSKQELQGFGIIVAYISGVISFGPLTGNKLLPVSVRMSIAVSLALSLYGIRFGDFKSEEFVLLILFNAIHGSMIGWSASLIFHAFQSAGRLIDDTRGMVQVTLLDPAQSSYTSQSGMLLFLIVCILFFYSGAYKLFIIAILNSSIKIGFMLPPFKSMLSATVVPFFYATILFALPFCITFFLSEIVFGILNRSIPSLNVYFLLHQAKILLGLFVLVSLLYNIENISSFFSNYFSQTLFLTKF